MKATRVAGAQHPDRLEHAIACVVAPDERARVRHDRQRPAAEQHARGETFVELGGAGRGGRQIAAQVPTLERRPELAGEGRLEPPDEALSDQLVVTPDVEERRDHRAIDR